MSFTPTTSLERLKNGRMSQGSRGSARSVDPFPEQLTGTSAKVSARMAAVRQRDTAPELAVRRLVYSLGVRYRVCSRGLAGRPDLSNQTQAWCIFVHGCFWHGHKCKGGRLPKINLSFWEPKIERNRQRDHQVCKELQTNGFRVLTVWQCELAAPSKVRSKLAHFFNDEPRRTIQPQ